MLTTRAAREVSEVPRTANHCHTYDCEAAGKGHMSGNACGLYEDSAYIGIA